MSRLWRKETEEEKSLRDVLARMKAGDESLTEIYLYNFNLVFANMKLLTRQLSQPNSVTSLNLSSNSLTGNKMQTLTQSLPRTKLTILKLSWTSLEAEDMELLAQSLPQTQIAELDLKSNNFGSAGCIALASSLPGAGTP